MSTEKVAPETRGVTIKQLAAIDLGSEIEGMAGRQLCNKIFLAGTYRSKGK